MKNKLLIFVAVLLIMMIVVIVLPVDVTINESRAVESGSCFLAGDFSQVFNDLSQDSWSVPKYIYGCRMIDGAMCYVYDNHMQCHWSK